jgi:hypothetical protein
LEETLLSVKDAKTIKDIKVNIYLLPHKYIVPAMPSNEKIPYINVLMYLSLIGFIKFDTVDEPVSISHIRAPAYAKIKGSNFSGPAVKLILPVIGKTALTAARPINE